jgi:hypothetical protein
VAGPKTKRGRQALALAGLGGAILLVSALGPWVQPARVSWPNYTDGVPDWISHPSEARYRLVAALLGAFALAVVALVRLGVAHPIAWVLLGAVGLGGIALGLVGLETVAGYRGFGSMVANDMTLSGFQHGPLNYAELAGAALLCVSPLAALRSARARNR